MSWNFCEAFLKKQYFSIYWQELLPTILRFFTDLFQEFFPRFFFSGVPRRVSEGCWKDFFLSSLKIFQVIFMGPLLENYQRFLSSGRSRYSFSRDFFNRTFRFFRKISSAFLGIKWTNYFGSVMLMWHPGRLVRISKKNPCDISPGISYKDFCRISLEVQ